MLQRAAIGIAQLQAQAVKMFALVFHRFFNDALVIRIGQSLSDVISSFWRIRVVTQGLHQYFHALCIAQALPHIGLCNALALSLVAVQYGGGCNAFFDGGQLPSQIVHVGDTGVQAQAAGWRETVPCIAGQKDPALSVALCHLGRHHPGAHVLDMNWRFVRADGLANQALAFFRSEVGHSLMFFASVHQDPCFA